jgi:hypothetical protein
MRIRVPIALLNARCCLLYCVCALQGKTNFFERRVGEYQKAGVMANRANERITFEQFVFTTDEDF